MSDWLDNFGNGQLYVTEGEKILMRFAMDKERQRIIKLVQDEYALVSSRNGYQFLPEQIDWLVALIKGENNG
jgi:hypothetical protein